MGEAACGWRPSHVEACTSSNDAPAGRSTPDLQTCSSSGDSLRSIVALFGARLGDESQIALEHVLVSLTTGNSLSKRFQF